MTNDEQIKLKTSAWTPDPVKAYVPSVWESHPPPAQPKWQVEPPKDPRKLGEMACAMLQLPPSDAMKIAGIICAGVELGLAPMTAARSIYIINGRPTLSSEMQRGLVLASPKCRYFNVSSAVKEGNDLVVTAEGERIDGTKKKVVAKRSMFEHLMKAESKSRVRWIQYPERMLIAAASRWLIRDLFPDVISGFADFEEHDSVPSDGNYVDLPPQSVAADMGNPPNQPDPKKAPPEFFKKDLNPEPRQAAPKKQVRKVKDITPPPVPQAQEAPAEAPTQPVSEPQQSDSPSWEAIMGSKGENNE